MRSCSARADTGIRQRIAYMQPGTAGAKSAHARNGPSDPIRDASHSQRSETIVTLLQAARHDPQAKRARSRRPPTTQVQCARGREVGRTDARRMTVAGAANSTRFPGTRLADRACGGGNKGSHAA